VDPSQFLIQKGGTEKEDLKGKGRLRAPSLLTKSGRRERLERKGEKGKRSMPLFFSIPKDEERKEIGEEKGEKNRGEEYTDMFSLPINP